MLNIFFKEPQNFEFLIIIFKGLFIHEVIKQYCSRKFGVKMRTFEEYFSRTISVKSLIFTGIYFKKYLK